MKKVIIGLTSICAVQLAIANVAVLAPTDNSVQEINKTSTEIVKVEQLAESIEQPNKQPQQPPSMDDLKSMLAQNPAEFEQLLSVLLLRGDADALKELLPIYQEYNGHDLSVIEWGNAIIDLKADRTKQAIDAYRKLNSALPNVKSLQFQMAMALYRDRQFDSAKSQFEKLQATASTDVEKAVIEQYLNAIARQDRWNVSGYFSFLNDQNLNNAPETGTTLKAENGSEIVFTSPREKGQGFNLGASVGKRFLSDRKMFTEVQFGTDINTYWNNKKYDSVSFDASAGVGYQISSSDISVGPFFNKRLYAGGSSGDGSLGSYLETLGGQIKFNYSINPNWRYTGAVRLSDSNYTAAYRFNDSDDQLYSNSLIYLPDQLSFWLIGLDFMHKKTAENADSFERQGIRLGWGQTWSRGISTRFNVGYAERDYKGANFFGIVRENKEYSAGLNIWHRGLHFKGLTPQLVLNHSSVDSTSPFEVYQKNNISIELTKDF